MTNRWRTNVTMSVLTAALLAPAATPAQTPPPVDLPPQANLPAAVVRDATVHFGQPQPQTPAPAPVGAAVTHFLFPDEVTINKGGTVTFVVNGGGHGIAIHAVARNTTRDDIAADLCQGGADDADRTGRALVCNGTVVSSLVVDGTQLTVTGTQNLDYSITDGMGNVVIQTGFNAGVFNNPRVDDPDHGDRLLATSGASPRDTNNPPAIAGNKAGALLTGSANPTTAGNRSQVRFDQVGRYLVVCMNRAHFLNDHMFGFVNVIDAAMPPVTP